MVDVVKTFVSKEIDPARHPVFIAEFYSQFARIVKDVRPIEPTSMTPIRIKGEVLWTVLHFLCPTEDEKYEFLGKIATHFEQIENLKAVLESAFHARDLVESGWNRFLKADIESSFMARLVWAGF